MVKALTWTPDKLQILGIKKDTAQSLHSVLSVNEGGVLVNPDILDPALAAPFSVKSYTGGLHLHPAFTFDAVKYYTTASKTLTTVKEGAVTYLGTGVGGNLLFNPVLISLTVDSVPATMYIDDEILIEYSYAAVDSVKLYYSINAGAFVLAGTYPVAASILYDTSVLTLAPGDTLTFKLVDAENTAVSSTASAITVLGVSLEITSLPAKAPVDEDITITWSSLNVATVDISVGLVSIVTDLDASLGTYTFQLDPLEFDVNASYTATLADHAAHADPDFQDIYTLATITHNSIEAMVAGVAKTITGTTNGASLLVYYRLHGAVSWTYAGAGTVDTGAGTWSYSLTLPTADTYDVLMVDGTDADANDTETIDVASAYTEGKVMLASVTTTATETLQYSSNSGANWSAKGTQTRYTALAMSEDGKYGLAVINGTKSYLIIEGIYSETSIGVNKSYNDCAVSKTGQYMMMAHDSGIYVSIDYGSNWTNYKSGIAIKCCCMSETGEKMYGFATNGRVWVSTDYGSNWTSRDTADRGWAQCVCSKNADYVYGIVAGTAYAYKFTNNGATVATIGPASKFWLDISCSGSGDKIMLCNFVDAVYYSSDYGANFGTVGSANGFRKCKISGDGNYAVKYTSSGYTLSVAQSPFTSWTNIATKSYTNLWISYSGQYMLAPVDGASGGVFKSSNYGATWASVGLGTYNWNIAIGNTKR